ncbi:hypothetical protein Cni_G01440 [Canna indica]|uniref:Uncharacterized protein n=1 Tax=Canna indica TaxID=4628 RepID=A0AAQ3JMI2_9LILI|nr:hypothetical protein Cni_G01440 [Canna indica]
MSWKLECKVAPFVAPDDVDLEDQHDEHRAENPCNKHLVDGFRATDCPFQSDAKRSLARRLSQQGCNMKKLAVHEQGGRSSAPTRRKLRPEVWGPAIRVCSAPPPLRCGDRRLGVAADVLFSTSLLKAWDLRHRSYLGSHVGQAMRRTMLETVE